MEVNDGVTLLIVSEFDFVTGHDFDPGPGIAADERGPIFGDVADEVVDAVQLVGCAHGEIVLDEGGVHGRVVVFEKHVVKDVEEDLCAVFVDAVAGDVGAKVADKDLLASVERKQTGNEDCQQNPSS